MHSLARGGEALPANPVAGTQSSRAEGGIVLTCSYGKCQGCVSGISCSIADTLKWIIARQPLYTSLHPFVCLICGNDTAFILDIACTTHAIAASILICILRLSPFLQS